MTDNRRDMMRLAEEFEARADNVKAWADLLADTPAKRSDFDAVETEYRAEAAKLRAAAGHDA